jgi:glycosyltransferase involved in cell wall biosynthesis
VTDAPGLRIAVLTYRGYRYSGGQGVYVRMLSGALSRLGHSAAVLSGPPYPVLDAGIELVRLPSLELFRPEEPFRPVRPPRDAVDLLEWAVMSAARFPEPLTFSLRAWAWLRRHRARFDVVLDNQSLGWGVAACHYRTLPVAAMVHHPTTVDLTLELQRAPDDATRRRAKRFYAYTRMQAKVARRLPVVLAPAASSRADAIAGYGLDPARVVVVPNGVDAEVFAPAPDTGRIPGRLVVTTSADISLKGLPVLAEAVAKLRTGRRIELVVVGRRAPEGVGSRAVARLGLDDVVRFTGALPPEEITRVYAEAQVAVVPSLYEGFCLPAAEAMASGVPLVATTGGALPEVTGPDGEAALCVPPDDPDALAVAIERLLDDAELRARLSGAGRARVLERFTWERTARATAEHLGRIATPRR